jgi:hypothetical protein
MNMWIREIWNGSVLLIEVAEPLLNLISDKYVD